MTALVMSSEVDVAIERILGESRAIPDVDSGFGNPCEDGGLLTSMFGRSMALEAGVDHRVVRFSPNQMQLDERLISELSQPTSNGEESPPGGNGDCINDRQKLAASIVERLIDDAILGLVFDVHRSAKTGLMFLYEENCTSNELHLVDDCSTDVFGRSVFVAKRSKDLAQLECVCPHCQQPRLACRFAPHLEKCMGMGRNSSRVASRRLAAAAAANLRCDDERNMSDDDYEPTGAENDDDDDDDDDWTLAATFSRKRTNQRKRDGGVVGGYGGRAGRKRGGALRTTPKKAAANHGLTERVNANGFLAETGENTSETCKSDTGASETSGGRANVEPKKMRKASSFTKLASATSAAGHSLPPPPPPPPMLLSLDYPKSEDATIDLLTLTDSFDPPSPSF